MKRYLTVVLLLLLIQIPSALGQEVNPERRTLKGLKKLDVVVVIGTLDAETQGTGLSEETLKTDVELRLRRSRVPVADFSLAAHLYVSVTQVRARGVKAYSATVSLYQSVTLDRDKSISCLAPTWDAGGTGVVSDHEFVSKVRQTVGDHVDRFINDYLAENPFVARDVAPEKPSGGETGQVL